MPGGTGISTLRDRYSQPLYVLLGIVGLVLAIACANMANLLLAQSVARRKELAVRLSLGAGRWRLVRQLLVESIMLSTIGAVAGLLIARWGSRAIVAMLSTRTQIVEVDLAMDWRVFAFTTAVGVLTGLLFGVAPAFRGTRLTPADALRDHSRGVVSGGGRFQVGHALVALQVALSFVLVFGSTLFVRTLVALTSQDMGFESSHVLVGNLDLRATGVDARESAADVHAASAKRLRAVPGVEAAATSFVTPVSGSTWNLAINVPGYDANERARRAVQRRVTRTTSSAMGTPLLAGRDIADTRSRRRAERDRSSTKRSRRNTSTARTRSARPSRSWASARTARLASIEIVGMVANAKYQRLREARAADHVRRLRAGARSCRSGARIAIRTAGAPMDSRNAIVAGDRRRATRTSPSICKRARRRSRRERAAGAPGRDAVRRSSAAWRCCSPRSASTA